MSKVEQYFAAAAQAGTLGTSFVSLTDAEAISSLQEHFGMVSAVARLPTEKDDTFRIDLPGGGHYLLKVANPFENESELAFECELLQHVAATDPKLPIPNLVPTIEGAVQFWVVDATGSRRHARLMTYLEGMPLDGITGPLNSSERERIGEVLARLRLAMAGFHHPADGRVVAWDVQNFLSLDNLLDHVTDHSRRRSVAEAMGRFAALTDHISSLRRQVLHNDFNRSNIIVDRSRSEFVTGIIDFGDSVRTAIAIDVATALLNQLPRNISAQSSADLFSDSHDLLRGYLRIADLSEEELALIPHLTMARCATRALITTWRAQLFPERAKNILRYTESDWSHLEWLLLRSADQLSSTFL
jgi:hydroxylysine kinase